jgi:hemerythrin-like metal-binding protein
MMEVFNWTADLASGNLMIDNDHKHLIDLVNKLHHAMAEGAGNAVLGRVLDELVDYTVHHFAREEKLMRDIQFTDSERHKAEHEKLIEQVAALQSGFKTGSAALSNKVYRFLTDWLNTHIKTCDKQLGTAARTV